MIRVKNGFLLENLISFSCPECLFHLTLKDLESVLLFGYARGKWTKKNFFLSITPYNIDMQKVLHAFCCAHFIFFFWGGGVVSFSEPSRKCSFSC